LLLLQGCTVTTGLFVSLFLNITLLQYWDLTKQMFRFCNQLLPILNTHISSQ